MRRLAAILGFAGTMAMAACASPGAVRPVPPATSEGGGWHPTAGAPLAARHSALAVTVGQEMLVLGGSDSPACPPTADCAYRAEPRHDAAAYAPDTDTWRTLAAAPLGIQVGDEHAVLGRVVYLLVRPDPTTDRTALLAYDVERNSWQTLPAPPAGYRRLVATDRAVVAYLSSHENDGTHDDVGYDPAARTWTAMPADPLAPSFDRVMVWADDRLVLIAPKLVPQPGGADGPSWLRAATYDPAGERWRALPEARQVISGEMFPVWDGTRLLNPSAGGADGGDTNGYGRTIPFGGWLDVDTGEWASLPKTTAEPRDGWGVTVASASYAANGSVVLDVAARRWLRLPPPPDPVEEGSGAQWVGNQLVVWGGVHRDGERATLAATGAVWTAPQS